MKICKKNLNSFTRTGFIVHANNLTVFFGDSIQEYNFLKTALIISTALSFSSACKKKGVDFIPDCNGAPKSFSTDVRPIILASCSNNSGSHGVGSNNGVGELLTYSKIFNDRSKIRSSVPSGDMPLNESLTSEEKNAILCWIDGGGANN